MAYVTGALHLNPAFSLSLAAAEARARCTGSDGPVSQLPRMATSRAALTNGYLHRMFCLTSGFS